MDDLKSNPFWEYNIEDVETETDKVMVSDGTNWASTNADETTTNVVVGHSYSTPIDIQNTDGIMSIEANGFQIRTEDGTVDVFQKLEELEQQIAILTGIKMDTDTTNVSVEPLSGERELDNEILNNMTDAIDEIHHSAAYDRAMKGV